MKINKNKKILTRVIVFMFFIIPFLISSKTEAKTVIVNQNQILPETFNLISYTTPIDNEIMVGDDITFNLNIEYPKLSAADSNKGVTITFYSKIDGVIFDQHEAVFSISAAQRKKREGTKETIMVKKDTIQAKITSKKYEWWLYEKQSTGKTYPLANGSFNFKTYTKDAGWYNITKSQPKTSVKMNAYNIDYEVNGPFETKELCDKNKNDLLSGVTGVALPQFDYSIEKECTSYNNRPATPNAIPIDPQKQQPTMDTVYTLLAPIGDLITAPTNIGDYFNILLEIAIGLCAVLAVIMIVIGGIQYMGDESIFGKTEAKGQITKAILGLLIALGAFALLNTIDPALLGTKGLNVKAVSIAIEEPPILSDAGKTVPQKNSFSDCKGGVRSVQTTGIGEVQHFIFCAAYATKLQQLFTVAYKANPKIVLTGGAFRTYEEQLQARKDNNCPNVLTSPANKCTPPTAIPGTSLHEQGLALDLYCDGKLINVVDNPSTKKCFDWLKTNAGVYGFKNFEKENWHWSIGPNAGH